MKKIIFLVSILSFTHAQALETKHTLLSSLQNNHKQARQLIKSNKEQAKREEREERKNRVAMTKNEAIALTTVTSIFFTVIGCSINYLAKNNPKPVETAFLSFILGTSIGCASYYEQQKEKPSSRLSQLLDASQRNWLNEWGQALFK